MAQSTQLFAGFLFFGSAALYVTCKKYIVNNKESRLTDDNDTRKTKGAKDLLAKFQDAALKITSMTSLKLNQSDKIMLYGLYKQAMEGDRDNANVKKPLITNIAAWVKYDAWGKFKGNSKEDAMTKYVEVVQHFICKNGSDVMGQLNDDNADIIYDTDEDSDEGDTTFLAYGMGMKPSTMMHIDEPNSEPPTKLSLREKLRFAASAKDASQLQTFLVNYDQSDIDDKDEFGQTPLHLAADKGSLECTKLLLEAGANPNLCDESGISILQTAVVGGSVGVINLLLEAGADPDTKDEDGESARTSADSFGTEELRALFNK